MAMLRSKHLGLTFLTSFSHFYANPRKDYTKVNKNSLKTNENETKILVIFKLSSSLKLKKNESCGNIITMYIDRFVFYNYNGVKIKGQNFFSQKKFFYLPKLRHWIFYSLIFLLCFIPQKYYFFTLC